MRTLDNAELNNVSGGTFGLISALLGGISFNKGYSCAPVQTCKPVPAPCKPVKKGC